jgi:hypothetical protein
MTNMFLSFDFHIEFKPGAANIIADALSRRDTEEVVEVMVLSEVTFKLFDVLRREIDDDPELHALRNEAAAGVRSPKLVVLDSLLTIEGQVYMPPASPCHHVTLLTMQSKAVNKVFVLSCRGSTRTVASVVCMGRVLLQHCLPFMAPNDTVLRCLWL